MKKQVPISSSKLKILLFATLVLLTNLSFGQVVNMNISPNPLSIEVAAGSTTDQTITISNSGNAQLEWSYEGAQLNQEVSFAKLDREDWTLAENQDRITGDVWITRANNQGIFNILEESGFSGGSSPIGTEWAYGKTADLPSFVYTNWRSAINSNPPAMVGQTISMHTIGSDRYFDIEFTEWTEEAGGGGFAYNRVEVIKWASLSANNGTVNAGAFEELTLSVDATNVTAGTYDVIFIFSNNATSTQELRVPVQINVTGGESNINVSTEETFNSVLVGASTSQLLTIVNEGAADLVISNISSDNSVFTSASNSLTVAGYSTEKIELVFSPVAAEAYSGTLSIESNDAASPTEISLLGTGIAPPVADFSSSAFSETLDYGNVASQTLSISNTGSSDLEWSAKLVVPNTQTIFTKENFADPALEANQDRISDFVWLTRSDNKGLYNIKQEPTYKDNSPIGTEWSDQSTADALFNNNVFSSWEDANESYPPGMIGDTYSMRTTADNRYFDIELSKWTQGGAGGGFSYTRTESPGWVVLSAISGTVASAGTTDIDLNFNANRFEGTYQAQLIIITNDPLQPEVVIDLDITVNGESEIVLPQTNFDLGNVFVGSSITTKVEVVNNGSKISNITDVAVDNSLFTVNPTTAAIAGGGSSTFIDVTFTPTAEGVSTGTMTIASDDPINSSLTVNLAATGLITPAISVTNNDIVVDLDGPVFNETINIENTQGVDLEWSITGGGETTIEGSLASLNKNSQQVLNELPGKYVFAYDGGPGNISDGGNDIYDGGNEISTNFSGGAINYSDNVVADGTGLFGEGTTYFTRHLEGLFVLAADLNGVTDFTIDGDIGADGGGVVTNPLVEVTYAGNVYQAYVKIVSEGGDPSIHQMIIVQKNTGIIQEFDESSEEDFHQLTGLLSTERLYYLLFTLEDESAYGENRLRKIMSTFLNAIAGVPEYITLSAESGTTASGVTENISISIDPANIPKGLAGTSLKVISNDINTPEVIIPITFTGAAEITLSDTNFDFGDVYQGSTATSELLVTNLGVSDLELTNIVSDNPQYTFSNTSFTLASGEEEVVTITFTPNADGLADATFTLTSNDPANGTLTVAATGNGFTAPTAIVTPESISVKLFPGESVTETISIENTQGIDLEWQIDEGAGTTLNDVLGNLNTAYTAITDVIPSRYDFTYDLSENSSIETGGNSMFSTGNYIINSASPLAPLLYSDNVITEATSAFEGLTGYFGEGSQVFTRHLPGLFVLAADMNEQDAFATAGGLGSLEAETSVSGTVLEMSHNGKIFQGFVKRVSGGITPSVNHLIIIEKDAGVSQDINPLINGPEPTPGQATDNHLLTGLINTSRLYYLMYGGTSGAFIDDVATTTIMQTFLETVLPTSNLSVSSGTTVAGNTDIVNFEVIADNYSTGITKFDLVVTTNDPAKPEVFIPVTVSVGNVRVENSIEDIVINEGFGTAVIDISNTFLDAESDALTFSPASSRNDVVTSSVISQELTITEVGIGSAVISIAATDGTNTAFADFNFRVNAIPVVINPIADQVLENGFASTSFDLSAVFADADMTDELSYTAILSEEGVVSTSITNGILTLTEVGLGTMEITVTANDGVGGEVSFTFALSNKADQTINFSALESVAFGADNFELMATATSELPLTYTSSNETVAIVEGTTVTVIGIGNTTITASQEGNDSYNAAVAVSQELTVVKANQLITFSTLANVTFGDANFTLGATTDSGLEISYTSSNTAVATITGDVVSIVGAGSTTITASQSGDDNYNAATAVTQELTVLKADQTITFSALANVTVGDDNFSLAATTDSGLEISYTSSNTAVATISGNEVSIVGAGTTTITASQAGNENYNAATVVSQELVVEMVTSSKNSEVITAVVYPNPTSNVLHIKYPEPISTIQLFDAQGRNIETINIENKEAKIEMMRYPSGFYYIQIDGISEMYRFVKK